MQTQITNANKQNTRKQHKHKNENLNSSLVYFTM